MVIEKFPLEITELEDKEDLGRFYQVCKHKNLIVSYLDIDNFKYINDTYGYEIGDKLINDIAIKLINLSNSNFKVYKLGEDEFLLLFTDYDLNSVNKIIDYIVKSCNEIHIIDDKEVAISVSAGIYKTQPNEDLKEILRKAELAMHISKMDGKSRFTTYTDEIEEYMKRKTKLMIEIKKVIKNDEFYVLYQPIYDLKEKRIKKVEALARWKNDTFGEVSPAEFIPILEELGMINEFGILIIEKIFKQMKKWSEDNLDINVNINISPLQLKYFNKDNKLLKLKDKYQIDFKRITFELTEGQLKDLDEEDKNSLNKIKEMGAKIALDDFGRGYSQLFNLFTLPINEIKIDRDIIKTIENDYRTRKMLECFIKLTKDFGYDLVGEGIETKSQFILLNEMECNYIQGYFISKPMDGDEVGVLIKKYVSY